MTYRDLLNIFKQRYPGIGVHDYRPAVKMHIPMHMPGIVLWTEQGDVIVFYLNENELGKLASCPFEEPVGAYEIAEKAKTNFEDVTASPERLAEFLRKLKPFCARSCNSCPFVLEACNDKDWLGWLKLEVPK